MKVYLIRHGQTTGDIEDRYGGDYDDHLTEEGRDQGKKLAVKLQNLEIEKIFSSPRIRAQETAEILKAKLNVEVETKDDLRERNLYGVLSGMVKAEAKEKYPELTEQVKDYKNTIEGAESYEHCRDRVVKVFWEISKEDYRTVGIVSHGGALKSVFREILKIEVANIEDCGFAEIEVNGNDVELIKEDGIAFK